jgi:hypothetical protein
VVRSPSSSSSELLTILFSIGSSTFRALALTSRSLLPVARRYIFANPLGNWGLPSWPTAINLVTTLKANQKKLGRLVKSLLRLPEWTSNLANKSTDVKLSFQVRGFTKAFSWFLAMLNTCPSLKSVGVGFDSTAQLNKVVSALSPSLPVLNKISFKTTSNTAVNISTVHKLAKKVGLVSIDELEIVDLDLGDFSMPTPLPFAVQTLDLSLRSASFDSVVELLPTQYSSLRSLTIASTAPSSSSLLNLARLVGPSLTSLTIRPVTPSYVEGYRNYGRHNHTPVIPVDFFALFPHMKDLELSTMRALSLERLKSLSINSPDLISLSAPDCIWVADAGVDETSSGWQARLFPQDELVETFKTMEKLESVHLGTVPLRRDYYSYSSVEWALKRQGVSVDLDECVDPCPSCGDYH